MLVVVAAALFCTGGHVAPLDACVEREKEIKAKRAECQERDRAQNVVYTVCVPTGLHTSGW